MDFDYNLAFSRNLGWLSKEEQKTISETCVAIPGMGGVGGHHLHTLARLGFMNFKIADFDNFEIHNFNRQIGARVSTIGRNKATAMKDMILDINPNANIEVYETGVTEQNIDSFLTGVDLLIDGLDLYVIKERIKYFDQAIRQGITVITAGPLGMGTSGIVFKGKGISFSNYCQINLNMNETQLVCRFLAALAPIPLHVKYLYYKNEVDMSGGKAPSLHTGVLAATTFAGVEATRVALKRKNIKYAPWTTHYDFYQRKIKNSYRPWGNRNPIQRVMIFILEILWKRMSNKK